MRGLEQNARPGLRVLTVQMGGPEGGKKTVYCRSLLNALVEKSTQKGTGGCSQMGSLRRKSGRSLRVGRGTLFFHNINSRRPK